MKAKKETIEKLYKDSISEIIWTHKIQATVLDNLRFKRKIYNFVKESLVGLSGFVSVLFLYFEVYIGALISSVVSTVSIIVDNVFHFNDYDNRIRICNDNVNDLWHMKEKLMMNLKYLQNDIIGWDQAKKELEENLENRKVIYSRLETPTNKEITNAEKKLKIRRDEDINSEFFEDGE